VSCQKADPSYRISAIEFAGTERRWPDENFAASQLRKQSRLHLVDTKQLDAVVMSQCICLRLAIDLNEPKKIPRFFIFLPISFW
jgi:hypothetical protein